MNNFSESLAHQAAAWGFAALTLLGAGEMIHEQQFATAPVTAHSYMTADDVLARGEGKNEAARMPEEYDVGLKAPGVSGF